VKEFFPSPNGFRSSARISSAGLRATSEVAHDLFAESGDCASNRFQVPIYPPDHGGKEWMQAEGGKAKSVAGILQFAGQHANP
jgi:hypothetical protein